MMTEEEIAARRVEASSIVNTYMGWSAGASFIPLPWVDLAAVTLIQIKMVGNLASLYQVPFSRNIVKTIIAGLLGSLVPTGLARGASSLLKSVPGIGTILGVLTAPVFTTASTYAIGKVFIQHFEAGGTILNFNPDAMREHFKEEFEAGVSNASGKSDTKAAA
jgi:uncharacterized protein (DUF697 family)